jgi:hypothetical protein
VSQRYFGHGTGWVKRGGIFWFRVFGWGLYRIRGERPYLLRPGQGPRRAANLLWRGLL